MRFVLVGGVATAVHLVEAAVPYLIAQLCASVVVLFFNFIGNSIRTFGVPKMPCP